MTLNNVRRALAMFEDNVQGSGETVRLARAELSAFITEISRTIRNLRGKEGRARGWAEVWKRKAKMTQEVLRRI